MSVRYIDRETAAPLVRLTPRHLLRLHDSDDPPPWVAGAGYDAEKFGQWMLRRFRRDVGVAENGKVYDYETERARLTKAQADKVELEAHELRGEMVLADHVIEAWARMLGAARSRLLSLPSKAAPRVRAAANDEEAARLIESEVLEALEELSSDGLPDRTRSRRTRNPSHPEAAAEADGERMGGRVSPPEPRKRGRARKVAD